MLTIEQRLERLEDESAIRELAARFADAATRNDMQTLKTLFTPDAVFTIAEPNFVTSQGPDEISALIQSLEKNKDFFVQFVHSGLIEIVGDKARARWILQEVAMGAAENSASRTYYNNFGFFHDELQKMEGKWLFTKRAYAYMYLDTDPFQGKGIALKEDVSFT